MIVSLLEAIDSILSNRHVSWGAVITALLFFNKIQRNKEFRIRDKRVERNQQRIMAKLEVIGEWAVDKPSWSERATKKLSSFLQTITSHVHFIMLFIRLTAIKNWRYIMQNLLSKKFALAILGALIPVVNVQFGLNLDINTLIGIWTVLGIGIAGIAHVDRAKILTSLKTVESVVTADPNASYQDVVKMANIIHTAIGQASINLQKRDLSQECTDAKNLYAEVKPIIDRYTHPAPIPPITEVAP